MKCVFLILALSWFPSLAQAKHYHVGHPHTVSTTIHHHHFVHNHRYHSRSVALAYNDGRPRAWCGWYMRHEVGSDPGPEYNLARNWEHWGHATSGPAPGVIGVMAHHVFKVVEVIGHGIVMAISGNDSHTVRTRPRSISGVLAWRVG